MRIPSFKQIRGLFSEVRSTGDFLKGVVNVGRTLSGIRITIDNSMGIAAVYAAVRIITDAISLLPTHVIVEDGNNKTRDKDHPLFRLISREPNSLMTNFVFWQIMFPYVLLWGNAYAIIEFEIGTMRPISILPVHPSKVKVEMKDGLLFYTFRMTNGSEFTLDQTNVIHLRGLGDSLEKGKSVIEHASENLGLAKAAESFGASFFGNGANNNGVLEHPGTLGDKAYENISTSLNNRYGGISKANKMLILEEGMKFTPTSISPDKAQFLETRKFGVQDVSRWFKVAPHLLADLEKATFSNIEEQDLNFVKFTILPWLTMIEQEFNRKLLREDEKGTHFIKKNLDALLRGDIKTRFEAHKIGIQNGFLTPNEARMLEEMNPLEGLNSVWMQLNTAPVVNGTNQQQEIEQTE